MGEIHRMIEKAGGKSNALMAYPDQRAAIEAASAYMADESGSVDFLYAGWCQVMLPHRKLAEDSDIWRINGDRITLQVVPGVKMPSQKEASTDNGGAKKAEYYGVPYGSRARLIMIYLQSQAIRNRTRQIPMGQSLRQWIGAMGIPAGGKSITAVRDQANRISQCRISLQLQMGQMVGLTNQNLVDTSIFLDNSDPDQGSLFTEVVTLSETFYQQLVKHSVPLEESAIKRINNNSMALDVYAWLAYRLRVLEAPLAITWTAIKHQFGTGFVKQSHFRKTFNENLKLAQAVYPAARVDVNEQGLVLHPSDAPVISKMPGKATLDLLAKA